VGLEWYAFMAQTSVSPTIPKGTLSFVSFARTRNPQPVLMIYVSIETAIHLAHLPVEEVQSLLEEHYIPKLPNYCASNPACSIISLDRSTWSADPLTGNGSYTHIPAGSDTGDRNMRAMATRILDAGAGAGLWFAGEHTSKTEVINGRKYSTMATVTGAYKSGERAAKQVLDGLFGSSCKMCMQVSEK
jgi:hypothetical protein